MKIDPMNSAKAFAEETRTIAITLEEAWLLDNLIRHTWPGDNQPIGKALLLKAMSVIVDINASSPRAIPVALTENELWAIDYHVRRAQKDEHGLTIGQPLLLKVFSSLLSFGIPNLPIAEGEEPAGWRSKLAGFSPDGESPNTPKGDPK